MEPHLLEDAYAVGRSGRRAQSEPDRHVAAGHARLAAPHAAGYLLALLSLSGLQALEYLYHQQQWFHHWPHLLKLADPLVVMLPFCLYGYIRALQGEAVLGGWRDRLVHGLPLLLVAGLALPYWLLPGADKVSWILLGKQGDALWPGVTLYGNRYLACIALLGLAYWWQQQRLGVVSRKPALRAWVAQLQGLQLLVALLLLGRIALSWLGWPLSTVYLQAPVTAYLLLQVLAHARLPQQGGAPEGGLRERANDTASEPVRDDGLRPLFEELERQLGRGAYRDPALSLGKLAEECGLSLHQASSAINACSGGNFYDWLNRHRVEEAKRLLQASDETVANVCYRAGFNSKSTFNSAFRRHTGQTPSEFRRQGAQAVAAS